MRLLDKTVSFTIILSSIQHCTHYHISGHLYNILVIPNDQGQSIPGMSSSVTLVSTVSCFGPQMVHPLFTSLNLPPYSLFLNSIEEFFSAWHWKVYDHQPYKCISLPQAMEEACEDNDHGSCQAWTWHCR